MNVFEKFNEMDKKTKIIIACILLVVLVIAAVGVGLSCSGDSSEDNKVIADNGNKNIADNQGNEESKANTKKLEKTGDANEDELQNEISSDKETDKSDTSNLTEENDNSSEEATTSISTNPSTNDGDGIIGLNGNSISYGGAGAVINGSEVTITDAGDYYVTGTLNDGRIIVNADSDADITINFMGVDISNSDSCCIYVISADKVVLNLNDGTSNVINDGKSYVYDDATEEEPNAAIFSKDDLFIEGNGKLTVNGNIYIKGGNTSVVASDDGLNAAGGNDTSSSTGNKRPGMGNFSSSTGTITFSGGTLIVDASGDGIDSNGTVTYNSGNVTVYGPTSGGNGTLDYDGSWTQNGGNFVGIGGKDMAQMPSGGSQYSVMVNFTSSYQSGTIVAVKNSSGTTVLEVTAKKSFQNLVFSNPNLAKGEYTVYINGNQYTTFTISSTLTTVGSSGGNNRHW